MLSVFNTLIIQPSYSACMTAVAEQSRIEESTPLNPDINRYRNVYSRLLQEGFAAHTRMYHSSLPSSQQLNNWSAYMHIVINYYGPISQCMGTNHLSVTIPPDAPRLHHLLMSEATQPAQPTQELLQSLQADPSGGRWIERQFSKEQEELGIYAPSKESVQKVISRAQEFFLQTT